MKLTPTTKCRQCGAVIAFVETAKNHHMTPVEPYPTVRDGSDPPPAGKYYTRQGEFFDALQVPCKVEVYRSHWSDCPGAEKARKK